MTLLTDLRNLITRKKSPLGDENVELTAEGAVEELVVTEPVDVVEEVEVKLIRDALRESNGNKSQAARLLGLTRKGLRNKIIRYNIET